MTQTTDDPAIPQQGPVETYVRERGRTALGDSKTARYDAEPLLAKARRVDTAFDALESAARYEVASCCGNVPPETMCPPCQKSAAALALAEGVRS